MSSETIRCIATGLYSGLSPVAPGTAGTVAVVVLWWILSLFTQHISLHILVAVGITLIGWWSTRRYLLQKGLDNSADPSEIVIDEWAGMYIVLVAIPHNSIWQIVAAFCLFRFYDILKIWPMSALEKFPGADGIMLDDLAAGIFALATLIIIKLVV